MIIEFINEYGKFAPIYGPGYSNHLPMAQFALYSMGAPIDQVKRFTENYLHTTDLVVDDESVIVIDKLEDCLGDRQQYNAYIKFFNHMLETVSVDEVVRKTLQTLRYSIGSTLFHGLIRLSYGIASDNREEVVRALAFMAANYYPITEHGKKIPITILKPEYFRFIHERSGYFHLMGSIEEKEQAMVDALSELYLNTGSFIVLHTITGLEALVNLKSYFEDYDRVLDIYSISVLRALLRVEDKAYKNFSLSDGMDFEVMKGHVMDVNNPHTIKLLYATERLYGRFKNDKLRKVAQLKLFLDHKIP